VFDLSVWSETAPCSDSGTVTVPKGRKFVLVNIVEEYSYDMPQNGGVEAKLSVQGPAGPLFTWHDAQGGLAGGVPPWTVKGGVCLQAVSRALAVAPADDGQACPTYFDREVTKIIDVSSLTTSAPFRFRSGPSFQRTHSITRSI
jgi:hypothetical protein